MIDLQYICLVMAVRIAETSDSITVVILNCIYKYMDGNVLLTMVSSRSPDT